VGPRAAKPGIEGDFVTTPLRTNYTDSNPARLPTNITAADMVDISTAVNNATAVDNGNGTVSFGSGGAVTVMEPLLRIVIVSDNTSPAAGAVTYYNAKLAGHALTPTLLPLSSLPVGARCGVRRDPADPADATSFSVTINTTAGDHFYSSNATSTTLPLSGEQREYMVISVGGVKYWAPAGTLNPVSGLVTWANEALGVLPATSGQHLTTQGGVTLDDGSGHVVIPGGTLDGVTIGATTAAVSLAAKTMSSGTPKVLSGSTGQPWLNQLGSFSGSNSASAVYANQLSFTDAVNFTGSLWLGGLLVQDTVVAGAVGPRTGIYGHVIVNAAGTNTQAQAGYVAAYGRAETGMQFTGSTAPTSTGGIGSFWAGWDYAALTTGALNQLQVFGREIDVSVQTGASVASKVGLLVTLAGNDAVRGNTQDVAIQIAKQATSGTWLTGLMFGSDQALGTGNQGNYWPFNTTSTLIYVSSPPSAGSNPCGTGIDLSNAAFSDAAIKTGPAAIQMANMASAPTAVTGKGRIYVASDNSLHYLTSSGDTQIAPTFGGSFGGNAATATKLATARTINGVAFDGSANITVTDSTAEKTANKNQASGYAGLDSSGHIPAALWPSAMDEIVEYANLAAFPGTGATQTIYLALDTGKFYRWSGSTYGEISPSPGSTDSVPEGSVNLYYTQARADARVAAGNAASATKLSTARNINGVAFDGTADVTVADSTKEPAITAGTSAQYWRGDKTMQTLNQDAVPDGTTNKAYTAADKTRLASTSGTNTGDQTSVTGNAGTATKLANSRNINGVAFDGSADITVTDSTAEKTANKNVANGYAGLDSGGKVAASELPSSYNEYIGSVGGASVGVTNAAVPAGAIAAMVTMIGPGGAGGSGAVEASGTVAACGGGAGGGGTAVYDFFVPPDALGTTFSAAIPTAPTGGAAQSSSSSNGNNGATGGSVISFTTGSFSLIGFGGASGSQGTTSTGIGGSGTVGFVSGGAGASASTTGGAGFAAAGAAGGGPCGGGSGAGVTTAPAAANGGQGGRNTAFNVGATPSGGVVGGAAPSTGPAAVPATAGAGGGGGASSITGNGQAGASATGYGGGGGGGGAALNGHSSGKGGDGGPGYIFIRWIYN
jgi:hypothetical protein